MKIPTRYDSWAGAGARVVVDVDVGSTSVIVVFVDVVTAACLMFSSSEPFKSDSSSRESRLCTSF